MLNQESGIGQSPTLWFIYSFTVFGDFLVRLCRSQFRRRLQSAPRVQLQRLEVFIWSKPQSYPSKGIFLDPRI